jgi:hypothetical protein
VHPEGALDAVVDNEILVAHVNALLVCIEVCIAWVIMMIRRIG